jgi:hypothetical protein
VSALNRVRLACLVPWVLAGCRGAEPNKTPRASASPVATPAPAWQLPTPTLKASALPHQESLYDVVTTEFVRQGWKWVCVGVVPDPTTSPSDKDPVDPPEIAVAWLRSHNASFRPASACRQDGEEVLERSSGARGGVLVIVWGADVEARGTLVRVTWCCWTGWGSLLLAASEGGWTLAGTENWLQT